MKVTANNLGVIFNALGRDQEGKQRNFPLSELTVAIDITKEIKKNVKDDQFIDGEIKLGSEQKAFILKLIDELKWDVHSGEAVLDTINLLKK